MRLYAKIFKAFFALLLLLCLLAGCASADADVSTPQSSQAEAVITARGQAAREARGRAGESVLFHQGGSADGCRIDRDRICG